MIECTCEECDECILRLMKCLGDDIEDEVEERLLTFLLLVSGPLTRSLPGRLPLPLSLPHTQVGAAQTIHRRVHRQALSRHTPLLQRVSEQRLNTHYVGAVWGLDLGIQGLGFILGL